ncbi:hypothetical protein EW145_g5497 [Phellinidium pouzarii]|uniref:DUF6593 domain-containing protein n=1 Tax=Phellinidium pouzarii TaxID=167371 RepID=A0A4S4KZT8_9AGAM|nr:hypothetical protein EW145_g5497 [Phellinidium pouzarii]
MSQRLSLTTTSLQNVVISNASDVIYYEIVTPKWAPAVTRVSKMDPKSRELEIVAELQNEVSEKTVARPTAVRLRGQQFRPAGEFWTKDGVTGTDARFRGKDGKYYQWRERKGRLELMREQEPDGKPVAIYHRHRRYFLVLRMSQKPYLEVQPSVMETLDSLIGDPIIESLTACISDEFTPVSFLLMEQKRRSGTKEGA